MRQDRATANQEEQAEKSQSSRINIDSLINQPDQTEALLPPLGSILDSISSQYRTLNLVINTDAYTAPRSVIDPAVNSDPNRTPKRTRDKATDSSQQVSPKLPPWAFPKPQSLTAKKAGRKTTSEDLSELIKNRESSSKTSTQIISGALRRGDPSNATGLNRDTYQLSQPHLSKKQRLPHDQSQSPISLLQRLTPPCQAEPSLQSNSAISLQAKLPSTLALGPAVADSSLTGSAEAGYSLAGPAVADSSSDESSQNTEAFSIEYENSNNETKKATTTKDVLDLIVNYLTTIPTDPHRGIKKINKISGSLKSIILASRDKLNDEYIEYTNRLFPNFFCMKQAINSRHMPWLYLSMVALIESQNNKDFSLKEFLKDKNFSVFGFLTLEKCPRDPKNNFSFTCHVYFSLLKAIETIKSSKIKERKERKEKRTITTKTTNAFDNFSVEGLEFENLRKEFLAGLYCCIDEDNPALKRLKHCLKNTEERGSGNMLDLIAMAKLNSQSQEKRVINLMTLSEDEKIYLKKKRDLPALISADHPADPRSEASQQAQPNLDNQPASQESYQGATRLLRPVALRPNDQSHALSAQFSKLSLKEGSSPQDQGRI